MDHSIAVLTHALKQIFNELKPNRTTFSFVLLIGKQKQGKSALLSQSRFQHFEVATDRPCEIFYNVDGIILELSEEWIQRTETLFEQTLRSIEKAHSSLRISGLLLAIDARPFLEIEPVALTETLQEHTQLITRFSTALSRIVPVGLIFTKCDGIAGFTDFFHQDSRVEHKQPLGFSIDWGMKSGKIANNYHARFNQLLEVLSQDILTKVHPARSSMKRMLIREFPLQLGKFHQIIHSILKQLPHKRIKIRAIYFTSAIQGGTSHDQVTQKISETCALAIPGKLSQSNNHRPYFVDGALYAFQTVSQKAIPKPIQFQKHLTRLVAGFAGLSIALIVHHHVHTTRVLDEVSKELLAYDTEQTFNHPKALFHLSNASEALLHIKPGRFSSPTLMHLKHNLAQGSEQQLQGAFIPKLLNQVESKLRSPNETPKSRYEALKIYLMLSMPEKRNTKALIEWFQDNWQQTAQLNTTNHQIELLKKTILTPKKSLNIEAKLVRDTRNYLNALPAAYLYYGILKDKFPQDKLPLKWDGFSVGAQDIPSYYTKAGYQSIQREMLPKLSQRFIQENWILERRDLDDLALLLEQAYAYDYLTWWRQFIKGTALNTAQNYAEARKRLAAIEATDSMRELARYIQMQTRAFTDDSNDAFNQTVASQFTNINLISETTLKDLSIDIRELHQFLNTLAMVKDNGHTAFQIAKARFQNDGPRNALSSFYLTAKQLPEPLGTWAKQIADDTWFLLMTDTKQYINHQWQALVYPEYQQRILNRYPFLTQTKQDVTIDDFNHFFSGQGTLQHFLTEYIKPFLDTSKPAWPLKVADDHVLPISDDMVKQFVRANIIHVMFFPNGSYSTQLRFTVQKVTLDPVISKLELTIGDTQLKDSQSHDDSVDFRWPRSDAVLKLRSIEGQNYELSEMGPWGFFRLLDKLNILLDKQDSSNLHVLFEINGNSGRYVLKTNHTINPFTPGILNDFYLKDVLI